MAGNMLFTKFDTMELAFPIEADTCMPRACRRARVETFQYTNGV